jgi:hypothetical protein
MHYTAKMNRDSTLTTCSIAADSMISDPSEHVFLSRETPIIIQNPNVSQVQETIPKVWAKYILLVFVVGGLTFLVAIVLVVLAVMGYLGKGKVEELEIVQWTGTATGTVNAVETGSSAGTRFIVDASGGMGVRRDI